jgi:hypothetical protein
MRYELVTSILLPYLEKAIIIMQEGPEIIGGCCMAYMHVKEKHQEKVGRISSRFSSSSSIFKLLQR